jgi:transcriptional regulator with XRE-family HTH domain
MKPKVSIQSRLVEKKITQRRIAEEENVSPGMVSRVCSGDTVSRRLGEAIAKRLGCSFDELFEY